MVGDSIGLFGGDCQAPAVVFLPQFGHHNPSWPLEAISHDPLLAALLIRERQFNAFFAMGAK